MNEPSLRLVKEAKLLLEKGKPMTVGELRKGLERVADDTPVYIAGGKTADEGRTVCYCCVRAFHALEPRDLVVLHSRHTE